MLLLDEPTTGLDPQARHVVWDRLFRLKQQGVTLVLTTHYMDEAEQLCDRLVVMDGGRIVAEGSPPALIREYSTREVVELRFAPGENETAGEKVEALVAERARARWASGSRCCPTGPALRRRRRRGAARRCTAGPRRRSRCWSAAARSRTCSCASPAGRWSTDDARPPTAHDPARRRRRSASALSAARVRLLAGAVPPHLAGHGDLDRPRAAASSPRWASGSGTLVDDGARAPTLGGVSYLDVHRARPARGHRDADGVVRVDVPGAGRDQVGPAVPRAARHAAARRRRPGRPPAVRRRSGCAISAAVFLVDHGGCSARSRSPWALLCHAGRRCSPGWPSRTPIFAFAATQRERQRLRDAVPVRRSCRCSCSPARSSRSRQLPDWLEPVAWLTPLWHGVDLCRDLALGDARRSARRCVTSRYLLLWAVVGFVAGAAQLRAGGW